MIKSRELTMMNWRRKTWAVKVKKISWRPKTQSRESTARRHPLVQRNLKLDLRTPKKRRTWKRSRSIWSKSTCRRDTTSFSAKRSISTRICSKTTQRCDRGSTRPVSCTQIRESLASSKWKVESGSDLMNHFNNFTLNRASRDGDDDVCCTICYSLPIRRLACGRWLTCPSFLYWLKLLLVLDVGLNAFELLGPSNGNMKSIPKWKLEEQICVCVHPIVPLCGSVSMFHVRPFIDGN